MRILGWLPSTDEDPVNTGPAETIFRDHSTGVVAEGFRKIRATIAKRLSASGHRSILFFSGMPESGATSVATNTAMAFASSDKRVLLIDANFRRPDLHRVFGLQESPGFADSLATGRDIRQIVQATTVPNLDLLAAGGKEHRVYERLATQSVTDILDAARNVYDIIIIDAAPFVVAGDCMALAHRVDATVLVVRATVETRGLVSRIRNELAEVRSEFLGVLVNAVKSAPGGYLKGNIKTAAGYQDN
jgi:capsular exopolysaccharide synthesis family protein